MKTTLFRWMIVSMGAASVMFSSACRDEEEEHAQWQLDQEMIELSHRLELRRFQLQQSPPPPSLVEARQSIGAAAKLTRRLDQLRKDRSARQQEFDRLSRQFVALKETVKQERRRQAMGSNFKKFQSLSGKTFENASVAGIDDAGVTLRHSSGSARLRYNELSPEHRDLFALDASTALAAEDKERKEATAYEGWIDRQLEVARNNAADAAKAAEAEKSRSKLVLAKQNAERAVTAASMKAESDTSAGTRYQSRRSERYSNGSSFYSYYVDSTPLQYVRGGAVSRTNYYGACGTGNLPNVPAKPRGPWVRPDQPTD